MSPGEVVIGGRYVLGQQLGAGGMGVVHEAVDRVLGGKVAVKLLTPHRETDPTAFARLEREAKATARLGHANIVRVLDFGRHGQGGFLVMEQLGGETLDARLEREGSLSVEAAARIHLQLLDALAAAHAEGVLHRDVKPSNVFLTRLADGAELVKLLDFGLAYLLEAAASTKLTATGIAVGTPAYMAPERISGAGVDVRTDVYSVGVSLYECLTGELPFDADTPIALRARVLVEDAPSVSSARPAVSEALAEVVSRALAKLPGQRFPSAQAMADALRAALDGVRPKRADAVALGETLPSVAAPLLSAKNSAEITRPVETPAVAQLESPSARPTGPLRTVRRRAPRWALGVAAGVSAGALALLVLGALHVTREPSSESPSAPQRPLAPRPAEETPVEVVRAVEPPIEIQIPIDVPVEAPPALPIESAERRPRRRPRPPPPPSPPPSPEPEPSLDGPLRPPVWDR